MDRVQKYFTMPDGPEKNAFFKDLSPSEKSMIVRQQMENTANEEFNPINNVARQRMQMMKGQGAPDLTTDPGMAQRHQAVMKQMPPTSVPQTDALLNRPAKSPEDQRSEDESYMQLLEASGDSEQSQAMKKQMEEEQRKEQLRDRFKNILSKNKY